MQWEVVWEWAVANHVRGEDWQKVAEKLDLQIKAGQWPAPTLGELDSEVYNGNLERLGKNLKKRAETDHGQSSARASSSAPPCSMSARSTAT